LRVIWWRIQHRQLFCIKINELKFQSHLLFIHSYYALLLVIHVGKVFLINLYVSFFFCRGHLCNQCIIHFCHRHTPVPNWHYWNKVIIIWIHGLNLSWNRKYEEKFATEQPSSNCSCHKNNAQILKSYKSMTYKGVSQISFNRFQFVSWCGA